MNTLKTTAPNTSGIQVTLEEVKKMSDEELRLEVAQLHGWKGPKHPDVIAWCDEKMNLAACWWQAPDGRFTAPLKSGVIPVGMPDYPHDLNAAFGLIDLLADRGFVVSLENGLDKTWEVNIINPKLKAHEAGSSLYVPADTLARAICEALVLWPVSRREKHQRMNEKKENQSAREAEKKTLGSETPAAREQLNAETGLAPCPFCGKAAATVQTDTGWRVECSFIGACYGNWREGFQAHKAAVERWNKRAPLSKCTPEELYFAVDAINCEVDRLDGSLTSSHEPKSTVEEGKEKPFQYPSNMPIPELPEGEKS